MSTFQPREAFESPRFAQPPTFMRLPYRVDLRDVDIALIGVPYDGGTSYRPGTRLGPREIRAQSSLLRPYNPTQKVAPFAEFNVIDYGDVDAPPISIDKTYAAIERVVHDVVDHDAFPMMVGGDHSISLPVMRAIARRRKPFGLVHFDAHVDTFDKYFGESHYHGTPFRRGIEEGILDPRRMVQIGIRGPIYTGDDFAFQREHGITVIDINEVKQTGVAAVVERMRAIAGSGPVYVSFDIDSVDPAYAPGTGTPEVGGLTSYEALTLVRGLAGLSTVGFDLVEVSPLFDGPGHITSLLAANLLYEFLCTTVQNPLLASRRRTARGAAAAR